MLMRFPIKSLTKMKLDMLKKIAVAVIPVIAVSATTAVLAQAARDHITVVGAFTGVPLATAVAERFIKISGMKMPRIEANTTGGGFKSFCAGTGIETPDATTATRRIRPAEVELCEKNGVKDIIEVKFGYDALVPAHATGGRINSLNRKDLFLAMAKDVPDPKNESRLIPNPYKTWKEINPALPDAKIQITGPGPTIGSYDALINYIMVAGCKQFSSIGALESADPKAFDSACKIFRKDGAYSEFSNYDTVLQELKNTPDLLGIIGFSMSRAAKLNNPALDGIEPTLLSVSRQEYALTFPLYLYVKKAHVGTVPGIKEYLAEFTSENALSVTGYLFDKGVVPMPFAERQQVRTGAAALARLVLQAKPQ